jgi:protein-disulfide isomerase
VTQGATVGQTSSDLSGDQPERLAPLDEAVDNVRGPSSARLILEYGDYECPYSRQAYRLIQRLERRLEIRFAFRHFPLTAIHPHALAASCAAEAAALQGRYWGMHEILFHRQKALEDEDLRGYAAELGLDLARFERDRAGDVVLQRIERDVRSGIASGEVHGTPTLFIDGLLYQGSLDPEAITRALAGSTAEA